MPRTLPKVATALDAPRDRLDLEERRFVAAIREHGWFRTNIFEEPGRPGYSFSTGFWVNRGHPEVIVFGLKSDIAHAVLWDLYRSLLANEEPVQGEPAWGILGNHRACLLPVSREHYANYLGWSRWFYGNDDFPCLQLIWPDRDDVFPWELSFDKGLARAQPDLSDVGWLTLGGSPRH
jgi:hypothetical protein